jgi:hypothetical protein
MKAVFSINELIINTPSDFLSSFNFVPINRLTKKRITPIIGGIIGRKKIIGCDF